MLVTAPTPNVTATPPVRQLLEQKLPELILRLTDSIRFDAPRLPSGEELRAEVDAGGQDGLLAILDQLAEESNEMPDSRFWRWDWQRWLPPLRESAGQRR